jgi:hypothetical protein
MTSVIAFPYGKATNINNFLAKINNKNIRTKKKISIKNI